MNWAKTKRKKRIWRMEKKEEENIKLTDARSICSINRITSRASNNSNRLQSNSTERYTRRLARQKRKRETIASAICVHVNQWKCEWNTTKAEPYREAAKLFAQMQAYVSYRLAMHSCIEDTLPFGRGTCPSIISNIHAVFLSVLRSSQIHTKKKSLALNLTQQVQNENG